ncbi:meiosis-specific protein ASY3-like [Rutidosis leptorrhynchoides]|uniref:meiosis-specific protein ASY3-like n=1 Tax=Rutidosis leptorrhynchoides TaxID=125765 RepID=UPI003A99DA0A
MEMQRQRRLHDDHMSGNRSFGSIYQPCSQSRKMSIGVVVDSSVKLKSKTGTATVNELQTSGNVTSAKGIPAERKQIEKEVMSSDLGKQNEPPLVGTETSNQNRSYMNANGHPKVLSPPSASNVPLQPSCIRTTGMEPGSYFANQMSIMKATNGNEKKLNNNTSEREEGNQRSSYATPPKVPVPDEEIREQKTSERGNISNLALRLKVRELLKSVLPKEKQHNSETLEMTANNSRSKSTACKNDSPVSIHRPPLDTIETNSGSLDDKLKRPLTRSLTRQTKKIAPTKQASLKPQVTRVAQTKQASLDQSKQVQLDENVFSFVESWSKRPSTDVNQCFKTLKRKEREVSGARQAKTCVVEGVHKDKSQQATDGRKTKSAASNVSLFEYRTRESEIVKPNIDMKEKNHHQYEPNMGTVLPHIVDQDSFAKHSFTKSADPQCDLNSPAFELKTATKLASPISLFKSNQEDLDVHSLSKTSSRTKRSRSSYSKGSFRKSHCNAIPKNLAADLVDSPVNKPGHKENRRSRSPSKELHSESSEDDSPMTGPVVSESPYQEEDYESSEDDSPIKGKGDNEKFDTSEQDGLAGAVKLFALALERVQSRIHSVTNKQSAAILLSVSENIHTQLQNAESKIQNDIGKLTSLGKYKIMHTENQYQEQQEQLKRIYEKFKEAERHLEKCQSTLEGLEAHQIQVRGVVEKQRLSHKKLIKQTEESIEKQLNDAQTRLADVHRVAKVQMHKLKYGIAVCLKEGLLS